MAQTHWTVSNIPDQSGTIAVITGANNGIGYEAALALAAKNAHVILAVRSVDKGQQAAARIRSTAPRAQVEVIALDLASLTSVKRFASNFLERFEVLPLLLNNAGVMALPYRKTSDGFEMQFGTNHLGHFALTALLLPALLRAPAARVVNVSSSAHRFGAIDFANLDGSRAYSRWSAYGQSKLANLLFTYELQRRFAAARVAAISVACHPGYAATNLQAAGAQMEGSAISAGLSNLLNGAVAQSAAMGALPTLYAATAAEVQGGDFIGPTGLFNMRGYPGKERSNSRSYDTEVARRLWQASEELTGVRFTALDAASKPVLV